MNAQDPLVQELRGALAGDAKNVGARLGVIADRKLPIGELGEALVHLEVPPAGERWLWAYNVLMQGRRDDLVAHWEQNPDSRKRLAAVYAAFGAGDLVHRHIRGGAAERSDIEAVAAFLYLHHHSLEGMIRSDQEPYRHHAAQLVRAANRAQRQQPPKLAAFDALPRDAATTPYLGLPPNVGPTALTRWLTSPDLAVRARAVTLLRHRLGLPTTPGLRRHLLDEDEPFFAQIALAGPVTDEDVPVLIARLESDPDFVPRLLEREDYQLTVGPRRRLLDALIARATKVPEIEGERLEKFLNGQFPGQDWECRNYLTVAGRLGTESGVRLLSIARNTHRPSLAVAALSGVRVLLGASTRESVHVLAPGIAVLLAHEDPHVRGLATTIAAAILADHDVEPLVRAVRERARVVLAANTELRWERPPGACALGEPPSGHPAGADAGLLALASLTGDQELWQPISRRLTMSLNEPDGDGHARWRQIDERSCLLWCLTELVAEQPAEQAVALLEMLPRTALEQYGRSPVVRRARAMAALAVPDDRFAECAPWFQTPTGTSSPDLTRLVPSMPAVRARRMLGTLPTQGSLRQLLVVQDPESIARVLADPQAGQAAAVGLWGAADFLSPKCTSVVAANASAREVLCREGVGRLSRLPALAQLVVQTDRVDARSHEGLARDIRYAPTSLPAEDLAALRHMVTSGAAAVRLAAARRAAELGTEGQELCRSTLAPLAMAVDDSTALDAFDASLVTGVSLPDLPAVMERIARVRSDRAEMLLQAARLRHLGGLDSVAPSSISLAAADKAGIGLPLEVLRVVLPKDPEALANAVRRSPERTRISAMQLVGVHTFWSEGLESAILAATIDPSAAIRLAAYEALRTRDPDLWSCGLLLHEVVFDPDPAVRALAR